MNKFIALMLSFMFVGYAHAYSDSQIATAEKLLGTMKVDEQMLGGFESMLPIVNQLADNLRLNDEETVELKNIYRDWFNNDLDREGLKRQIAVLYAQTFTVGEMEDIIRFFESPTGQKLVVTTPTLTQKGAQLGMNEAQNKQHLLLEKLTPFIEKHQAK
ncbi:DUF2059 domain-containing protein [Vibrio sp. Y2-5]|uniref:DUF2059 domain-containing protein n=1 Tax=Vibrio TaxID=662 RepID=UPI00142DA56F|nr:MULTISPECIES: DUF2059 domain-containing protein [Vibrio]MBD0786131.1 DUF2059 domain-containing protein [Vibrio sp. Y2-5]NIY90675.1 DUF2059 domain-containing protein [Vibrio diazotrophicus]